MTLHPTQTQCSVSGLSGGFSRKVGGKSGGRGIGGEGMGMDLIKTQNMHGQNYQTIKYF